MKIFLIGLPGSGKSTLGAELARALDLTFVDLDTMLEKREGESIHNIFSVKGESYFREIESKILQETTRALSGFVMATGGGSPCFHNGIDFMNKSGVTVFLDVPVETIEQRMSASERSSRPLLSTGELNTLSRLKQLYQERIKFYNQAAFTVSGTEIKADDVLKRIGAKK